MNNLKFVFCLLGFWWEINVKHTKVILSTSVCVSCAPLWIKDRAHLFGNQVEVSRKLRSLLCVLALKWSLCTFIWKVIELQARPKFSSEGSWKSVWLRQEHSRGHFSFKFFSEKVLPDIHSYINCCYVCLPAWHPADSPPLPPGV